MKKSEFEGGLSCGSAMPDYWMSRATDFAEKAIRDALDRINRTDVTELWDPEGPELPKRIGIRESGLCAENACGGHRMLTLAEKREAAARYNAVEALLSSLEAIELSMKATDSPGGIVRVPHGYLSSSNFPGTKNLLESFLTEARRKLR